jgi:hypothetical protein
VRPARSARAVAALALLAGAAGTARAQPPGLRFYYLNAAAAIEATPFTDGGAFDFQRLRLMTGPRAGRIGFDIAYEHALDLRTAPLALGRGFEGAQAAGPWLPLQGTLAEGRNAHWRHGFDRLSVSLPLGAGPRLTFGRQPVSWATTLFFTPADPFAPFDPADPFREFRGGIDAARGLLFLGPLTQLDAVVRPADTPAGTTLTVLGRASGVLGGWELSGWAGLLHDRPAAAIGVTGSAGAFALRGEASLRRHDGADVVRAAIGVDRRFAAFDRDLTVVLEYQRDGLGAADTRALLGVATSVPAGRGELQVLGRDALAASTTYQAHPLASAQLLAVANLRDGSALLAPGLTVSAADEVSVRLGGYLGLGPGAATGPGGLPRLRSEHGATPLVGYAAVSVFFVP